MSLSLRIPFAAAIEEKGLLKPWMQELSVGQRAYLKIIYGCALDGEIQDDYGWTELDYYWVSQGCADYDELGYITAITPHPGATYLPQEFSEAWIISGVRAGKTDRLAATVTAYEATCGGHEAYTRKGRPAVCFQIAQDTRMAKYSLHSIRATLDAMPFIAAEKWVTNVTADRIELKNGVTIATTPPTVKSIRGYDAPVGVLDEVGVWYQDADSANPDFEIYRQVTSRQATFPWPKVIGITSPWNKAGLAYLRYEAGTNGHRLMCDGCRALPIPAPGCPACHKIRTPHQGRVVLHATSASLGNPMISRAWLQSAFNRDPKAFERECLARFQDSISSFLSSHLLQEAVEVGVLEHPPAPLNFYVAAIDPGFRHDAFGFGIGHVDEKDQVVIDVIRQFKAPPGETLDPQVILASIAPILQSYRVKVVLTDQYHFASLHRIAQDLGISLQEIPFTATKKASLYGNLQSIVNQRRLRIPDDPELLKELSSLEKVLTHGGLVRVGAAEGKHDDLATVVALITGSVTWLSPMKVPKVEIEPIPTVQEQIQLQIDRNRGWRIQDVDSSWL